MFLGKNYGDVQYIWKKWFCIVCFLGKNYGDVQYILKKAVYTVGRGKIPEKVYSIYEKSQFVWSYRKTPIQIGWE